MSNDPKSCRRENGLGATTSIRVNNKEPDEGTICRAVQIILNGGVVAFPTESFYGLGVDATQQDAVERLFRIKARESDRPVLMLIPSLESLDQYVTRVPEVARKLMKVFWPGGLTLVFEATEQVLPILTAGTGKIGVRLSSHPIAALLARTLGRPITGTSANLSGSSPTRSAGEVARNFGKKVNLILDGGRMTEIKASTVLDVTVDPPVILREGMVPRSDLKGFVQ